MTGQPRRSGEAAKAGPTCRPKREGAKADVAQLAERVLGKDEVTGSIPVIGSRLRTLASQACFVSASQ